MQLHTEEHGQASVEYLLVGLILLALMGALAALWHYFSNGQALTLFQTNASHAMSTIGGICDALMF